MERLRFENIDIKAVAGIHTQDAGDIQFKNISIISDKGPVHRSTNVHNISVIYGWEFARNAHFYLVYNSIREQDESDIANSVFIKSAYTFR